MYCQFDDLLSDSVDSEVEGGRTKLEDTRCHAVSFIDLLVAGPS